jgi:hypothetical protein
MHALTERASLQPDPCAIDFAVSSIVNRVHNYLRVMEDGRRQHISQYIVMRMNHVWTDISQKPEDAVKHSRVKTAAFIEVKDPYAIAAQSRRERAGGFPEKACDRYLESFARAERRKCRHDSLSAIGHKVGNKMENAYHSADSSGVRAGGTNKSVAFEGWFHGRGFPRQTRGMGSEKREQQPGGLAIFPRE